ncbi:hypothetical protein Micbo1qcDRAFT_16889 [Microdochium bolleyi]|uniref:Uncharacterized protein n=1 Tax=Microdochium bolleyi TaxID=196109 RepID=A0A136II18_9PEZI|nr:hypothetical protein Micbo1qcDRAFT_16889 [Microdochium bolleyi]
MPPFVHNMRLRSLSAARHNSLCFALRCCSQQPPPSRLWLPPAALRPRLHCKSAPIICLPISPLPVLAPAHHCPLIHQPRPPLARALQTPFSSPSRSQADVSLLPPLSSSRPPALLLLWKVPRARRHGPLLACTTPPFPHYSTRDLFRGAKRSLARLPALSTHLKVPSRVPPLETAEDKSGARISSSRSTFHLVAVSH